MLSKLVSVDTFRMDSEYFSKIYLYIHETIKSKKDKFCTFEHLNLVVDASAFYPSLEPLYNTGNLPFLRVSDVDTVINYENAVKIPDSIFDEFKTLRTVKNGDLVLTKGGSIARAGYIDRYCAVSRDLIFINTSIMKNHESTFLFCYLITDFANKLLLQSSSMTAQPHLTLTLVKSLPVFNPNVEIKFEVAKLYKLANQKLEDGKQLYTQAETLLLKTLGLDNFTPSTDSINIKSFKDSFSATGRLDAEYYQPKYDDIENLFNKFERIKLSDLVSYPISSGVTPKAGGDDYADAENGIPFVRAVDLKSGQVSTDSFNYIKYEIHKGMLKRTQLKKNDFLFSIAGTVGRCAVFEHDFEANINQAVSILRFNNEQLNRYYMMVLFNSEIGKEFVSKYARQGLQTNLNLAEVGELSIPIIDIKIQTQIADLVQQSFALKKESEHLLEKAKQAVELAIEQGEDVAMAYLGETP